MWGGTSLKLVIILLPTHTFARSTTVFYNENTRHGIGTKNNIIILLKAFPVPGYVAADYPQIWLIRSTSK